MISPFTYPTFNAYSLHICLTLQAILFEMLVMVTNFISKLSFAFLIHLTQVEYDNSVDVKLSRRVVRFDIFETVLMFSF